MSGIDYVVHAAALKQVPAAEHNPMECIKTNVHGAENIVDVARDSGVKKIIGLSSDKASNPINLYGATKLASDKLIGLDALSDDRPIIFFTPLSRATSTIFSAPCTLVLIHSIGLYSATGTRFNAAA
jgi:nucleoside-diphosphate-sugar epimerase